MNILKFFGFRKEKVSNCSTAEVRYLALWEDNMGMIELLPIENLQFTILEAKRIEGFAREHFDGTAFTDITTITSGPVATIERKITVDTVVDIMKQAQLQRVLHIWPEYSAIPNPETSYLTFGTTEHGVIFDTKDGLIENIWFTGWMIDEVEIDKMIMVIQLLKRSFDLLGVNWNQGCVHELSDREDIMQFVHSAFNYYKE